MWKEEPGGGEGFKENNTFLLQISKHLRRLGENLCWAAYRAPVGHNCQKLEVLMIESLLYLV